MDRENVPYIPFDRLHALGMEEARGGQYRAQFLECAQSGLRVVCRIPMGSIIFADVLKDVKVHM
jgi:hypothetical protein